LLKNKKRAGIVSTIVICFILLSISFVAITYRQRILDQITVWSYQPSSDIINVISKAGMNDGGKFYFFANRPALYTNNELQQFNDACENIEISTAILGCYTGTKIHVRQITDEKLEGVSEVTAAHETLHAVYDRLDDGEKSRVNTLLEAEYKKIVNDKYYSDLIAYYAKAEPGQRSNELHSIIGTEITDISPQLEEYYARYFSNRQTVVDLHTKYNYAFKALKIKANKIEAQLNALIASVNAKKKRYNIDATNLNNDIADFNSRAENGGFSSQAQFDNERAALVARAADLDDAKAAIKADIARYEMLLNEYNSAAAASKKLYDAIDNKLVPSPSL
jgi:hypothetical protein